MSHFFAPPSAAGVRRSGICRLLLVASVAIAVQVFGVSSASAAAVCVPTGFMQDSMNLTAAMIDPMDSLVPENLDATGCNIGIYYSTGNHNLMDKHVFGANYYGILSNGSSATNNNISFSSVFDIGENPPNGSQHGIAVAYRNGAGGQLDHSQIYDYQKGGVLARDAGTNVQILDNVVQGLGPVPFIAQNGVQVSSGATGNVNGNFIEDHEYTGCSKAQAKTGSCTYTVSTGILLFSVDPTLVDTKNNTYRNNDVNLFNGSNL